MKLGKFFKNIVKGATKVVKTVAPLLPLAGLASPTLFGLTSKKGLVGALAKGIVGLSRTKGRIDPKKVAAVLWGMSALQAAGQQRQALDQQKQMQQFYQNFVIPSLQSSLQGTNAILGLMAGQALLPPYSQAPPIWWWPMGR